jgi:hypothetical protein
MSLNSLSVKLPLHTATKIWTQINSIWETSDGDVPHCNWVCQLTWQDVRDLKEAFGTAYADADVSTTIDMDRIKRESKSDWVMPVPEIAEEIMVQPKKKQRTDEALQTEPITYPNADERASSSVTVEGTWEKSKTGDGNWQYYPNIDSSWDPHHECFMPNWYWDEKNVVWDDEGKYQGWTMSRSTYDYWKANPQKDWKNYGSNTPEEKLYESSTPNVPWVREVQA